MLSLSTITSYVSLVTNIAPPIITPKAKASAPERYWPSNAAPPGRFRAKVHPLEPGVSAEVNGYFLQHWNFENEKARRKFVDAGFSRVTCFYYPLALDDRIGFACRLLTLLFLIDDILEDMSLEEGSAYNEKLIPISRGDLLPDRNVPVEWITYDLWNNMRACDKDLADEILEPTFTFMRAQTDKVRMKIKEMGAYLEYREKDVGKALLSALMRFSMNLHLSRTELESVNEIERNCSKQISVMNDIYSWEKELKASKTGHQEGAALCSSVLVMAHEANLSFAASKRVLWIMCREWELIHEELVVKRLASPVECSDDLQAFMKGHAADT